MAVWPSTLPQALRTEGFSQQEPDNLLETAMEVGPPKVRRRTTANVGLVNGSIRVDQTQLATFRTFYRTTLAGGALPFSWTDPLDGSAVTMMFKKGSVAYAPDANFVIISFQLMILP